VRTGGRTGRLVEPSKASEQWCDYRYSNRTPIRSQIEALICNSVAISNIDRLRCNPIALLTAQARRALFMVPSQILHPSLAGGILIRTRYRRFSGGPALGLAIAVAGSAYELPQESRVYILLLYAWLHRCCSCAGTASPASCRCRPVRVGCSCLGCVRITAIRPCLKSSGDPHAT
jgi:hypothetical protein